MRSLFSHAPQGQSPAAERGRRRCPRSRSDGPLPGLLTPLLVGITLLGSGATAARAQNWDAHYHGTTTANEHATAVAVDSKGNVYVTGDSPGSATSKQDFTTLKYSNTGTLLWTRHYDGPAHGVDIANAIKCDAQDNVVVTGYSDGGTGTGGTSDDYATVKYASDGTLKWATRYDGIAHGGDHATGLALDAQGNAYVAGVTTLVSGSITYHQSLTVKYDAATGAQLWASITADRYTDQFPPVYIALDAQGGVYVASDTGNHVVSVVKYSAAGVRQWVQDYDPDPSHASQPYLYCRGLGIDAQGNAYLAALYRPDNNVDPYAEQSYLTVKFRSSGAGVQWVRSGDITGLPEALVVDPGGNVYVTGASYGATTVKYDTNGNVKWVRSLEPELSEAPSIGGALALDAQGNLYLAATTFSTGGQGSYPGFPPGYSVVKYRADGVMQWVQRYNGPYHTNTAPISFLSPSQIALSPQGGVVVCGALGDNSLSTTSDSYLTLAYTTGGFLLPGQGFVATDVGMGNGVTGGGEKKLRVLWNTPVAKREATVMLSRTNGIIDGSSPQYLGSAGYQGTSVAVSPADNTSRLFWVRSGSVAPGQFSLFTLPTDLAAASSVNTFGPYSGWTPLDSQIGGDGKTRLLFSHGSTIGLWRLNSAGSAIEATGQLAMPSGYTLVGQIAVGPSDNRIRLLFNKQGAAGDGLLWTIGTDLHTIEAHAAYHADGYTFTGQGVGSDNKTRLLLVSPLPPDTTTQQKYALWVVPSNGGDSQIEAGTVYLSPIASSGGANELRQVPRRLRVGPDNTILVLSNPLTSTQAAAVRIHSADTKTLVSTALFGPY